MAAVRRTLGLGAAGLSVLGVWAGAARGSRRWVRAAPLLALVSVFFATSTARLLLEQSDDLEQLSMRFFICTTILVVGLRVLFFLVSHSRLQWLVTLLEQARQGFPEDGAAIRNRYRRHAIRVCTGLQVTAVAPVALWALDPVLTASLVHSQHNGTASRVTPLALWLPFDAQPSPNYEAVYVFEAFFIVLASQTSLFLDMFFFVLIIHITAELKVLNHMVASIHAFTNIQPVVMLIEMKESSKYRKGYLQNELSESVSQCQRHDDGKVLPSSTSDMYSQLLRAVRHHRLLMTCITELESMMSRPIFLLLSTNMMNMCLHLFTFVMLLQKDIERISMVKMLLTFPTYLYQTGTYCIFGQAIINQSEQLTSSAFASTWPDADAAFRQALLIFMLQASRPLRITVGKVVTLSRNTFLQILNQSYTVFNMLYGFQSSKETNIITKEEQWNT